MYKKIFRITLALLVFTSFSCSDDYLDTENKNTLGESNFYKTADDFRMALNSCYDPLAQGGMFGVGYNFLFIGFSDDVIFENAQPSIDELSISSSYGSFLGQMYQNLYFGFYRTNSFIDKINTVGEVEGLSQDDRNNYEAQAKAMRAMYAFYLVTIFNEPPFYDENTYEKDLGQNVTNGKAGHFWNMIKNDLLFCVDNEYLPEQYPDSETGRITIGAARALLGKAMLYKHYYYYANPLHEEGNLNDDNDLDDLRLAKRMFRDVMDSNSYSLIQPQSPKSEEDYLYAFLSNFSYIDLVADGNVYPSENNKESVWEVQYSTDRIGNLYLPGMQDTGSRNAKFFGPIGYQNIEGHLNAWLVFETDGVPDGFNIDPRAHATFYRNGDKMDLETRDGSSYHPDDKRYNIRSYTGTNAFARGLYDPSIHPSPALGIQKYYFPTYHKYDNEIATFLDPNNRRVIRYSDVLLMYAEVTEILDEDTDLGLDALNKVRTRMGMNALEEPLTKEMIKHERRVEFMAEGHRWFDMVRWSFDPSWNVDPNELLSTQWSLEGGDNFFVEGKHEYLPIPIQEINISNGNLEQNPGW